ncbi:MAG TPA: histidine kinase, partial [Telluria sp.]|nr:histidine kinase [Telluria sp.]
MQARHIPQTLSNLLSWLARAFDAVATWVSQLSWWKFFLFAALTLIAAGILQEELFSSPSEEIVDRSERGQRGPRAKAEPTIVIDDSGIHFNPRNKPRKSGTQTPPPPPPPEPNAPEAPAEAPAVPMPPPKKGDSATATAKAHADPTEEVHIDLPPQIGEELSDAIEQAVDDAAEAKVSRYHKQASTWFTSFVWLLVLALFGTKALVGGKKKAEAETQSANAAAERESMQRQLSEAKMQMMQAQVEPHFLFNTLASVEFLIETNPPRASAMQRSLIQYLRAVLPQMRETSLVTNLGREVDMVTAYLNLLKMRMEE